MHEKKGHNEPANRKLGIPKTRYVKKEDAETGKQGGEITEDKKQGKGGRGEATIAVSPFSFGSE